MYQVGASQSRKGDRLNRQLSERTLKRPSFIDSPHTPFVQRHRIRQSIESAKPRDNIIHNEFELEPSPPKPKFDPLKALKVHKDIDVKAIEPHVDSTNIA